MDVKELENTIKNQAQNYYEDGTQTISDDVFDALVDELRDKKPDSELLKKVGWGFELNEENGKIKHKYCRIGSLPKAKTLDDVKNALNKGIVQQWTISAKLDGMSVVLYYESSVLVKALTRGDGDFGIDITEKVLNIPNMSESLLYDEDFFTGAVRGEICMTKQRFAQYKEKYPDAKNARNSVAGIINSIDTDLDDLKYLNLFVYTIVADDNEIDDVYYTPDTYDWLVNNFIDVVPYYNYDSSKSKTNDEFYADMLKYKEYFSDLNIDGLVITSEHIRHNAKTNINSYEQIAFKFQDEIKITKVLGVEWTMSKNQAYIPVVLIEPVELEGTTVKRVSGYNAKWIKDMGIETGVNVAVRKANQIIPQILEVIK